MSILFNYVYLFVSIIKALYTMYHGIGSWITYLLHVAMTDTCTSLITALNPALSKV